VVVIEGFSNTVQSDDCAVARGNGPIHHGNAARSCVYILIRIARCVKRCCIAPCYNLYRAIHKYPLSVSMS